MGKKLRLLAIAMLAAPFVFYFAGQPYLSVLFVGLDIGIIAGYLGCAYQLYTQLQKASKELGAIMGAMQNAKTERKKRSKADPAASKAV